VLQGLLPEDAPAGSATSARGLLWQAFSEEERLNTIRQTLCDDIPTIYELADVAFPDVDDQPARELATVQLIDLAVAAQPDGHGAPLLPARYHFLVRSLEGSFVCRHPDHPDHEPRLLLARHETCPACADHGINSHMFEYGTCRRCGTGYAVGAEQCDPETGTFSLGSAGAFGPLTLFAFAKPRIEGHDEDEDAFDDDTSTNQTANVPSVRRLRRVR
jgi:hypothetical protein